MLGELLWKEKEGKALERKHLQYIIVFSKTTSQGPLLSQLLRNLNLDEKCANSITLDAVRHFGAVFHCGSIQISLAYENLFQNENIMEHLHNSHE